MKQAKPTTARQEPAKKPSNPFPEQERAPRSMGSRTPHSIVAKMSHTVDPELADRLERFAFFQRVSESAVIEHALNLFFDQNDDERELGQQLRNAGVGQRKKV